MRGKGNVHAVKDQADCGSCWAFAATGALEGMLSIKKSKETGVFVPPVHLSEQELVDCTTDTDQNFDLFKKTYNLGGCDGGFAWTAWDFSRDWGNGLDADYPYTARDSICKHSFDTNKIAARAGKGTRL